MLFSLLFIILKRDKMQKKENKTNEKFQVTIYPSIQRLFMRAEDQNAKIVHDLINRVVPRLEDIDLETLMDFLRFFNTSLDDDVDEVKHGFRFIVGYQAACIIPQKDRQ